MGRALKQCFLLPKIEPNEVIAVPFLQINSSLICSVDISIVRIILCKNIVLFGVIQIDLIPGSFLDKLCFPVL